MIVVNPNRSETRQQDLKEHDQCLKDTKASGKKRDWKGYKIKSLAVAAAYALYEELERYAQRIEECGSWLKFAICPAGHHKYLIKACFCRCRLCVMCQWRKSLVIFSQLMNILHLYFERYKTDIPMLLTLTVPNIPASELKDRLDLMQTAWVKMTKRRPLRRAVRGWFRALEVTYNEDRDDYHPHFHVLLIVPAAYFIKARGLYIERDNWLKMWQESMGMPEITQVDIRTVKKSSKKDAKAAVCAEVGKYATKPKDYVKRLSDGSYEADSEVVQVLHYALRNRRLVAYGGALKAIKKELKLVDVENADLVKIEGEDKECHCPICQSTLIETIYRWKLGLKDYAM